MATISYGPRLGLINNAAIGQAYYDELRPFLRAVDELLQCAVINSTTTVPPSSPNNGDAYLLINTPTGAWAGQQNAVAIWSTQITDVGGNTLAPAWEFHAPNAGWLVWDTAAGVLRVYSGSTWVSAVPATNTTLGLNTQTGTTYTLVGSDAGLCVEMNNAAANTLTIPPNASVPFPVTTIITVRQEGAGQTTIAAGVGVTIHTPETLLIRSQYGWVTMQQRTINEWCIEGNLQVAP